MSAPAFTVGVLVCDHVAPELLAANRGRDSAELYHDFLVGADPTLHTRAYDAVNGELPEQPDECDGWIITGARYDAYRDEPWIEALRRFVQRLARDDRRTMEGGAPDDGRGIDPVVLGRHGPPARHASRRGGRPATGRKPHREG
jgi:hypothetical protein